MIDVWKMQKQINKSRLNRIMINYHLNQGKTVVNVTPDGSEIMKRKKHLTLIEKYEPQGGTFEIVSLDEWGDQ